MKFQDIVIGGGASGIASAILLARKGRRVAVLEAQDRALKKVLASGNGRCNLSNVGVCADRYNNPDFVRSALDAFDGRLGSFFASAGLELRQEDGRIYPYSFCSGNVVNALLDAADKAGAVLRCGIKVMRIDKKDNGFAVVTTDGVYIGENVVFATGSNATSGVDSLALLAPLGHKCTKRLAAISYIPCTSVRGASGVRARAALTLFDGDRKVFCRQGELLFKDKALSGILAFEASSVYSRLMRRGIKCAGAIDFVPDKSAGDVEAFFALSDADCVQALCAYLHKSLAAAVAKRAGTEGKARDNAAILARTLKNYTLGFDGVCDIKNAQVVCGGLELTDFDPRTMESTKVKGLYATGEALDVDGECGGYNLHWAWASAYAAARAIAGEINV